MTSRSYAVTPLLQIERLTKTFAGQFVLHDITFDLRPGEILGLIGPNGAGKTTLLETLAGVLPADNGRVIADGEDIPQHRRRGYLFYVPEDPRHQVWDQGESISERTSPGPVCTAVRITIL